MMSQPSILGERRVRKTQLYTTLFEALHKNYPPLPEKNYHINSESKTTSLLLNGTGFD